jgi:hypothetical protein
MTTAARMTVSTPSRSSSADVKSLQARVRALTQAIQRLLTSKETITYLVVDDVLHACSSTGTVRQFVTRAIDRAGESGYEQRWETISPVPQSPAADATEAIGDASELMEARG